jgi:hypothetical protein
VPSRFGYNGNLLRRKDRPVADEPVDQVAARNHVDGTIDRLCLNRKPFVGSDDCDNRDGGDRESRQLSESPSGPHSDMSRVTHIGMLGPIDHESLAINPDCGSRMVLGFQNEDASSTHHHVINIRAVGPGR